MATKNWKEQLTGQMTPALAEDTLAAAEATGIPSTISWALQGYSRAFADTDPARALAAKRRNLALTRQSGNRWWEAVVVDEMAALEARHGEPRAALDRSTRWSKRCTRRATVQPCQPPSATWPSSSTGSASPNRLPPSTAPAVNACE